MLNPIEKVQGRNFTHENASNTLSSVTSFWKQEKILLLLYT